MCSEERKICSGEVICVQERGRYVQEKARCAQDKEKCDQEKEEKEKYVQLSLK